MHQVDPWHQELLSLGHVCHCCPAHLWEGILQGAGSMSTAAGHRCVPLVQAMPCFEEMSLALVSVFLLREGSLLPFISIMEFLQENLLWAVCKCLVCCNGADNLISYLLYCPSSLLWRMQHEVNCVFWSVKVDYQKKHLKTRWTYLTFYFFNSSSWNIQILLWKFIILKIPVGF